MNIRWSAISSTVLLASFLVSVPLRAIPSGDPVRGAANYQSTCLACHGPTSGSSKVRPDEGRPLDPAGW